MPAFQRYVESRGQAEHVEVADDLAPYYRANGGWIEVEPVGDRFVHVEVAADLRAALEERAELEASVAGLTGAELDAAVKKAGVEHPSTLTADEKRTALVEKKLHPSNPDDAADYDTPES